MRSVARVIATAVTSLLIVGLVPGVAQAGTITVVAPSSHFNDPATFTLTVTAPGPYIPGTDVSVRLFDGPGGDAIDPVTGTATGTGTVTASISVQNLNIGTYDVATMIGEAPIDTCNNCFTVDGYAPTGLAVSPDTFGANTTVDGLDGTNRGYNGFTISGQNFTHGPYTQCTSGEVSACAGPKIALVKDGTTTAVPNTEIELKETTPDATAPTPTAIVKRIIVKETAQDGDYDVVVINSAGKTATCDSCLHILPQPDVTDVALQLADATTLDHIGDNAIGQTVLVTGTDFPSDAVVSFSNTGQDAGAITYSGASAPVTVGPDQVITVTGVDTTQVSTLGNWQVKVTSASARTVSAAEMFDVRAAPTPTNSTFTYSNSSTGAYGQGAQDVAVTVAGTNLDLIDAAHGTRVAFTNLASGVTLGTQVLSADNAGTITVPMDIAEGTTLGDYTFRLVNPDGGRSDVCDNSAVLPPADNTCLLTVATGPSNTTISPATAASGQTKTLTISATGLHSSVNIAIGPDGGANWVTPATRTRTPSNGSFTVDVAVPSGTAVQDVDVVVTNADDKGQDVVPDAFHVANLSVDSASPSSWSNDQVKSIQVNGTNLVLNETTQLLLTKPGRATIAGSSIATAVPSGGSASALSASFDLRNVAPGAYDVTAINTVGSYQGTASCVGCFTVVAPAPTVSGASPSTLGGGASNVTVTISGTSFFPGATVTFDNPKVTPVGSPVVGATTITQVVNVASDATATTGTVRVTNTDTQYATTPFSTAPAPSVTGITPAQKPVGSSFTFTVNGSGFSTSPSPTLSFDVAGVTAGTVTATATQLTTTLTVSPSAAPGTVHVTVINANQGRATSPVDLTLTAQPVISGIDTGKTDPTAAPAGQSVTLQVVGTGFQAGVALAPQGAGSGLTITNVTRSSATLVTATVAVDPSATAGARTLALTNPDGGTTTTQLFVITPSSAPQSLAATGGVRQATVSWAAPASNGGSSVASYTVSLTNATPGGISPAPVTLSGLSTTVTGLANGATYSVSVVATNGAGNSAAATGSVTTNAFPDAPRNLALTGGVHQIAASWQAPASDGGSPVTSYTVRTTNNADASDTHTSPALGSTSYSVSGLVSGATYTVSVAPPTLVGDPPATTGSATTTGVPGAPTAVVATSGIRQLGVTWGPPASDGGSAVTSYTVSAVNTADAADTKTSGALASTARSFTLSGLRDGATYAVSVRATSLAGESAASTVTASTLGTPGAPTGVMAAPGDKQAAVSWLAPSSDGGSPVTGYTVTATPGPVSQTATGTSVVLSGLVNGTTYTITVRASNAVGAGPASLAVTARPMGSSTLTLSALPSRVVYGTKIVLKGTLTRTETSAPVGRVRLFARTDAGAWSTIAYVTPSSTGYFAYATTPSINRFYYASYGGDTKNKPFITAGRRTLVAPKITAYAPTGSRNVNQVITGSVYPTKPGKVVVLYRVTSTGSLVKLKSATLSSSSTYRFSIKLPAGTTRLRVVIAATPNNTSSLVSFIAKRT